MSYRGTSIKETLAKIDRHEILLPAFQRKFVWEPERIESLLDSLMRGYPIGTFLFWELEKESFNDGDFLFYEFIRDYSEFNRYNNPQACKSTTFPVVWSALDGQQRLTALYIAFCGSYAAHKRNHPWDRESSFPKKVLHVNLLHDFSGSNSDDEPYESGFKFFAPDHVPEASNDELWFAVPEMRKYEKSDRNKIRNIARSLTDNVLAEDNLCDLLDLIHDDTRLTYFLSKGRGIDDVLDIFIRVNSGGKILSRSDLLLSTIVANWPDAREQFDSVLDEINSTGDGFRFNIDFVVRCALACANLPMQLKVATFSRKNIDYIKDNWAPIREAIVTAVMLVSEMGFTDRTLKAANAVVPIVLFCYLHGKPNDSTRAELKNYLVIAQLNRIFGASTDNSLNKMNHYVRASDGELDMDSLRKIDFGGRSFRFTEEDIEPLLNTRKDDADAFLVLSLLYPGAKTGLYAFHIDHLQPQSAFETERLRELGLDEEQIKTWQIQMDTIPNLHFLDARTNESKNDWYLDRWLEVHPEDAERVMSQYCENVESFAFGDFEQFYEARKASMAEALKKLLLR